MIRGFLKQPQALTVAIVALLLSSCGVSSSGIGDSAPKKEVKAYLIPLYSYPLGQYQSEWERLYQLRTNKRVFVIVNVSNGPGERKDENFENAINILKSKGYTVLGYIYTSYGERDINLVKSEADKWLEFYGNKIDGFFLDEVSNSPDKYPYYEQVSHYLRSINKIVVLNLGTNADLAYFSIADKVVVFEESASNFFNFTYNDYSSIDPERVCTIVYNVASREDAERIKARSLEKNSACVYILEDDSYFRLSQYID